MKYLLINHVPFGASNTEALFHVGDLFLQDLRAQARAIREFGGSLIVATPLVPQLSAMSGGSFNTVEIDPREHGFEYVPLPRYLSYGQYFKARGELRSTLDQTILPTDVVQMDYGGYPYMLGEIAWPIAVRHKKKRIWLFDGADPFPRLELEASNEKNPLKRFVKQRTTNHKIHFCRDAIRNADLVFSHNAAVVERFKDVWNGKCHAFDRSFVTDEILLPDIEQRKRQLLETNRPLRLICAGRQIKIKGTHQGIEAVQKLREMNVAAELNVMGDGDDLPEFKKLARDLGLGDLVRFSGTVPYGQPLFDEWAKADIMLITNLTAEISRNVLLGAARGLPLVTYENPGTDALLRENHAAMIVPKGDIEKLACAIADLSRDRAKLIELAESGLKLAKTRTLDATHRRRAELAAQLMTS